MKDQLCFLACRLLQREIEAVLLADPERFDGVRAAFFPADCGKIPLRWEQLESLSRCSKTQIENNNHLDIHVLGNACIARLLQETAPRQRPGNISFHRCNQCFYLTAPAPLVDHLLKEGAYLVTPGSLSRWREDMETWGFAKDRELARDFFSQHTKRLAFLDSGIDKNSMEYLREFAAFINRPWQVYPVGLDYFRFQLEKIVMEWRMERERAKAAEEIKITAQKTADYAMAMDLLASLTRSHSESEVIRSILELFTMLFAPAELLYIPLTGGEPGKPVTLIPGRGSMAGAGKAQQEMAGKLQRDYEWSDSGAGFYLQVKYLDEVLGVLVIDHIAFPEYKQHYLNLALAIVKECGLALDNARKYRQIAEHRNRLSMTLKELELAKEEAIAANQVKTNFLARMSHELRTPLNAIIGMTNLLLNSEAAGKQRNYAGIIHSSANVLLTLINHIFDFTKIENGELQIKRIAFNLGNLLCETLDVLVLGAKEKGLEMTGRIEPALPELIEGDPDRLRQVLLNLLGNAVKFTTMGTVSLEVRLAWEDDRQAAIRFQVADTGIGIPRERLASIFTSFNQVDTSSTRKYGGTGLGLSIAARLIELMGGHIEVESKENEGTTFGFTLVFNKLAGTGATGTSSEAGPDADTAAAALGEVGVVETETGLSQADRQNATILLVEDNLVNRELMVELFKSEGIGSVLVAEDGKKAVEIAMQHSPDLVIMDIQMPVMDGNEATQQLRSLGYPGKIVALSACTIQEEISKTMEAGVDEYVTKPVDFDNFFLHIKKYLKKS